MVYNDDVAGAGRLAGVEGDRDPDREMRIKTAKAGDAVVKVVNRCEEAKREKVLDLSFCSLSKVPEAVPFILREEEILKVNLTGNQISKISEKLFGSNWSNCFLGLTALNVSRNRLSVLPGELVHCRALQSVDISHNNFVSLPAVLLELESLTDIRARANFISEVDEEAVAGHESLELLGLEENPMSNVCRQRLNTITRVRILLTERKVEDWEDLSI